MIKDHRDPWEVGRQVSSGSLRQSSNVTTSEVEVPQVYRPVSWRIHGPSRRVLDKNVSIKTTGTGEHLREAEEDTVPRSQ